MLRNTTLFAMLLALFAAQCSNSLSTPYCLTTMGDGVSSTFSNNFNCTQVTVSGSNHIFQSSNLPNHKSYYYGSSSNLYEALPSGNTAAGTNKISSQNLKYTIPTTPTLKSGTLTGTQAGYVSVGITANGLAVFNNAAAPPDNLSTEALTFDNYAGHPQNSGVYHHHAAVTKVSSGMTNAALVGVALDGYLIYDEYCNSGSGSNFLPTANTNAATGNSATDSVGDSATSLDRLHGHTATTKHLTTATYHYHYMLDPTATIRTLLGSYFRGVPGTVSN
ncbi:MAG: YHYH protein [Spirochaetes bacterium]|nr:YHYH protein [Spirochaetota bacterium]